MSIVVAAQLFLARFIFPKKFDSLLLWCFCLYDIKHEDILKVLTDRCFSITFADGTGASGVVYTDTVTVGGSTVTGQVVEFANTVSGFNEAGDSEDGIFGLAFDAINTGMYLVVVIVVVALELFEYVPAANPLP